MLVEMHDQDEHGTRAQLLERVTAPEGSNLAMPRAMLVFAHPDDEVIAVGGRMRRFRAAHFIHVTDGAPRNGQDSADHGFRTLEEYRQARRDEVHAMLQRAGLDEVSRECLDIPDQEAALQLGTLTEQLATRMRAHRPEVVITHPYEGGHPDHDACACAVHRAVESLRAGGEDVPLIAEAAFYHAGANGIETGCFLSQSPRAEEKVYTLTERERQQKDDLLRCFASQQGTLQYFETAQERFRIAPDYDFTRPPQPPPVFYDRYPWGVNSQRFCELACEAMHLQATGSAGHS